MEPRIQYAQTADGVSIALWTLGEGMPFVHMPWVPYSHVQLEWQIPECRLWYERLAEKRKLVRYDGRGTGLSERNPIDYSLDAHVLDLEAVVNHLALQRFALYGLFHSGPAAIAYAARHPERVSHLVLWNTYARASDSESAKVRALRRLIHEDWGLFTETAAHLFMGWSEGEPAHRFAAFIRESVTPEVLRAILGAIRGLDVTGSLPQLRSATLVLQRREISWLPVDVAQGLASRIPRARLALLEGMSAAPYLEDMEAVLRAIDEFLGDRQPPHQVSKQTHFPLRYLIVRGDTLWGLAERFYCDGTKWPHIYNANRSVIGPDPNFIEVGQVLVIPELPPPSLLTILFTDVEGSTSLTQRLGDAKAREVLRFHKRIIREALKSHGGSEVKTLGDGFMASFSSASAALECAIAMQRAFAQHNESAEEPIRVRIGLNAGEPIEEERDLFGTVVNLAARIAAQAAGGEILVANVVRELAAGKGFLFADRGEHVPKGFEEPIRLFEVRWER